MILLLICVEYIVIRNDNLKDKTSVGHVQLNIYLDKINLMITNRITGNSDKMCFKYK